MRSCKNCLRTDNFYPTQATAYCRTCFQERYFEPGRQRLLQAKLERGSCKDCGLVVTEENACMFDWDHLRDKRWNVGKMLSCSAKSFYSEIEKCELVCANDHRIRTQIRRRGPQPTPSHCSLSSSALPVSTESHPDRLPESRCPEPFGNVLSSHHTPLSRHTHHSAPTPEPIARHGPPAPIPLAELRGVPVPTVQYPPPL